MSQPRLRQPERRPSSRERLADPAVRVVVAGQQPGLLGGPLYCLAKTVAAARWAAALEAAGQPAVAVFWVATEDHDWAEVAHDRGPRPRTGRGPSTSAPTPSPWRRSACAPWGPGSRTCCAASPRPCPGSATPSGCRTVGRWYRPDARFGEAFCRLMAHLLGPRCPLLLDAMLPALKAAQRPWLRRLVERRQEVEEALARRDARGRGPRLLPAGEPAAGREPALPAAPRRAAADRVARRGRLRPARPGARAAARSTSCWGSSRRTRRRLPRRARPARPCRTPCSAPRSRCWGPGELSYMAQAAATHAVLEVEPPWVALRPQTLVLEAKQVERLEELGIPLATLLGDRAGARPLAGRAGGRRPDRPGAAAAGGGARRAARPRRWPPIRTWSGRSRRRGSRSCAPSTSSARRRSAAAARKNEVVDRRVQPAPGGLPAAGQAAGADRLHGALPGQVRPGVRREPTGSRWSSTPRTCR